MTYSKCIYTALILSAGAAWGQSPMSFSGQSKAPLSVQGSVVRNCGGGTTETYENLRVEVMSRQNSNRSSTGDVRWDGGFDIRDVSEGVYEAQVVTMQGAVLKRTIISVNSMTANQEVRLEIDCAEKAVAGSVSMRRLSHKPPKAAIKALRKATSAQQKGNVQEWEKQLRAALKADPDYFEARNNLGAFLVRHDRPAEALEEFRAALEIDPNASALLNNMAACLMNMNQAREAETFARRALTLDPMSPQAHYLIGVALIKQNRYTVEAADHLHDSGSTFPRALEAEAVVRERIRRQTGE